MEAGIEIVEWQWALESRGLKLQTGDFGKERTLIFG